MGQMMRKSEELLKYALEIWYFQSRFVIQKLGCDFLKEDVTVVLFIVRSARSKAQKTETIDEWLLPVLCLTCAKRRQSVGVSRHGLV